MPDPADRRPPLIPPHIGWPLMVILLLAMSVTAAIVTVVASRSDGGVRLVETPAAPAR